MTRETKATAQRRTDAVEYLRGLLKPGDTLWTKVEHVSRSGMSRSISCYIIRDSEPHNVSAWVAYAIGATVDRDRLAVKVSGCGMDMGFHVVYNLSRALNPHGVGCIGKGCPSNDHSNGDRSYVVHAGNYSDARVVEAAGGQHKGDHMHTDGGYALRHRWL